MSCSFSLFAHVHVNTNTILRVVTLEATSLKKKVGQFCDIYDIDVQHIHACVIPNVLMFWWWRLLIHKSSNCLCCGISFARVLLLYPPHCWMESLHMLPWILHFLWNILFPVMDNKISVTCKLASLLCLLVSFLLKTEYCAWRYKTW